MAAWSSLALRILASRNPAGTAITKFKNGLKGRAPYFLQIRRSHEENKLFVIRVSDFESKRMKNILHFYFVLGMIPFVLIISYFNIFVGSSTLAVIPEGYEPKPWEYYQHPISRFMMKYLMKSPQEKHERNLQSLYEMREKTMLRELEKKVKRLIKSRQDYKAWYVLEPPTYEHRKAWKEAKEKSDDDRERGISGIMV